MKDTLKPGIRYETLFLIDFRSYDFHTSCRWTYIDGLR